MGTVCSECTTYQQEFQPVIHVSKDNFVQVESKPQLIEEIKQLIHNQLPSEFKDYSFYRKGEDSYFIGQIEQNVQENYGVLYKPHETLYYGNFMNGYFNGKGILKLINKNITFQGHFNQGKPVQDGTIIDENNAFQFIGIWDNQFQPKSGILKLSQNKLIKNIDFIDFQRGNVEITYKNGSHYKGFIDKKTLVPEGIGKMTYLSGNVYDGEWVQGKFQGVGTYTWKNGQSYNGQYKNGLRDGEGTLHFSQQKYFTGYWKYGERQGFGKLVQKDGIILQKGIYKNNKFDYETTETYLDNFMARVPRDELRSQLLNEQKIDDLSIDNKMPNI